MTESVEPTQRRPRRRQRRGCLAGFVVIGVLAVLAAVVALTAYNELYRAENPVPPGQPVEFEVKRGQGVSEIGNALAKAGIIRNSNMFRLQARRSDVEAKLLPGTYRFATGMPYDLVLEKLASGPDIVYYDVTIPEGFTARRVAARFAKETGVSEAELLQLALHGAPRFSGKHPYLKGSYDGSLEGFLFPKTYHVKEGSSAEQIIEMMLKQFDAEFDSVDMTFAASKNLTVRDVVIIGSILERETKLPKEYPLVASVIYNRLALPMRLQLDSTVFYGLPEGTKILRKTDLDRVTPWNTYRMSGLPRTPICNPGLAAIKAAAKPAKSKYLYYVLTSKDGSQTFSTNYEDFLKAVDKYRKLFGY